MQVSLDGFVEGYDGDMSWMAKNDDDLWEDLFRGAEWIIQLSWLGMLSITSLALGFIEFSSRPYPRWYVPTYAGLNTTRAGDQIAQPLK